MVWVVELGMTEVGEGEVVTDHWCWNLSLGRSWNWGWGWNARIGAGMLELGHELELGLKFG